MTGGCRDDAVCTRQAIGAVDVVKSLEKCGQVCGVGRIMRADRDLARWRGAWGGRPAAAAWTGDPPHGGRKVTEKTVMQPLEVAGLGDSGRCNPLGPRAIIGFQPEPHPTFDFDMRLCFQLEIALTGVVGIVPSIGSLDIRWERRVPFDEVRVVAVDDTQQLRDGGPRRGVERTHQLGSFPAKGPSEVLEFGPAALWQERFHRGNGPRHAAHFAGSNWQYNM